jgi:hypothetical protein
MSRGLVTAQPLCRVVTQALEPDALAAPRHIEEQVGGDPVQPALESARRVAGQRAEDADEDLLGEILGVVGVAGQPVGKPVHPGGVLTHDLFPGRRRPAGCRIRRGAGHVHDLAVPPCAVCLYHHGARASPSRTTTARILLCAAAGTPPAGAGVLDQRWYAGFQACVSR